MRLRGPDGKIYRMISNKILSIPFKEYRSSNQIFCIKRRSKKTLIPFVSLFYIPLLIMNSCTTNIDKTFPEITHLAFQTEKNGDWGIVDVNGKVLFKNKIRYQWGMHPSCAINGVFRTWEFDQIQRIERLKYYTATEEPQQIGLTGGYKEGGIYSEGIIPVVAHEGRIHYINNAGDTVFCLNPYKGKEIYSVSSYSTEQRAPFFTEDFKLGYINPKGNVVIEPIYDGGSPFHEGKAIVYNHEEDKIIVIDIDGHELFEIGANGVQLGNPIFYKGYCIIGNFLCNDKGERIQRIPAKAIRVSSFRDGIALFQDKETSQWQQMDIHGNSIGDLQYDRVLGFIDGMTFVANTLPDSEEKKEDEDKYMNVYAIDKSGKVRNQIDNLFRFYPLYENVIISENGRYYFADKEGSPINNESFYFIDVPAYTYYPSFSEFVSYLNSSPHKGEDYSASVRTSYFDEYKTVASILDQLTDFGIGKLRVDQTANDLIKIFGVNHVPIKGDFNLGYMLRGINNFRAVCTVALLPPDGRIEAIGIHFDSSNLPSNENTSERISNAIISYLDRLDFDKEEHKGSIFYFNNQRNFGFIYNPTHLRLTLMSNLRRQTFKVQVQIK